MKIKFGDEIVNKGRKRGSGVIRGVASDLNEAEFIVKIDDLIAAMGYISTSVIRYDRYTTKLPV